MKYNLKIKPKYKPYAFEDENITSTNTINEVPTTRSRAFVEGSGPIDSNAESAFRSLMELIFPYLGPQNTFFSVLSKIKTQSPFIDCSDETRQITCFPYNGINYEIPKTADKFRKSLIQSLGLINESWSSNSTPTAQDVNNFKEFISQNGIVTISDYDNFLRRNPIANVNGIRYKLFSRSMSDKLPRMNHEVIKFLKVNPRRENEPVVKWLKLNVPEGFTTKTEFIQWFAEYTAIHGERPPMPAYRDYKKETGQTFEQIFKQESNYKGELLTLEALNKLIEKEKLRNVYNLVDGQQFALRDTGFKLQKSDQIIAKMYDNIHFEMLPQIIQNNSFFEDDNKELEMLNLLMHTSDYYGEIPSFKNIRIRPKVAFIRAIKLMDGKGIEKVNNFETKLKALLENLAKLTDSTRIDFKKFIYLLEAIIAIKYYYLKDRDKSISDKIRLEDINAHLFSADLLEKKPDFLLIPKAKYQKIYPTILVEFDGQQHYMPKGRMNFVRQKLYDSIKNNFFNNAPNHAIIRIPYNIVGESSTIDYGVRIYEYILPKIQSLIKTSSMQKVASYTIRKITSRSFYQSLYTYLFGSN